MLLIITLALFALPGATPADGRMPAPPGQSTEAMPRDREGCIPIARQFAGAGAIQSGARRLDQLPPAQLALAVDRQVDGCREAALVRQRR